MKNLGKTVVYNTTEAERKQSSQNIVANVSDQIAGIVIDENEKGLVAIKLFNKGLADTEVYNVSEGTEEGQFQIV